MPDMNDINTELLTVCKNLKKELKDFLKSLKGPTVFPRAPGIIVKIVRLDLFIWHLLQRGAVFSFSVLWEDSLLIQSARAFYGLTNHPVALPCKDCGVFPIVYCTEEYRWVACPECGHRGEKIDASLSSWFAVALWNGEQEQIEHKSVEQLYDYVKEFRESIES